MFVYRRLYISLWSRYKSPEFLGECPSAGGGGGWMFPPSICGRAQPGAAQFFSNAEFMGEKGIMA